MASLPGTKFWLSPDGQRFGRQPMEENHEDIGRRILQQLGVRYDHHTRDGIYVALFKLNFLRAVEYAQMRSIYVENGGLHGMTTEQRNYLDERCRLLGSPEEPWTLHFNDRLFMESRQQIRLPRTHVPARATGPSGPDAPA